MLGISLFFTLDKFQLLLVYKQQTNPSMKNTDIKLSIFFLIFDYLKRSIFVSSLR